MMKEKVVKNFKVSSAGTHSIPEAPASALAVQVAKTKGVDLSAHRSRQLTPKLIERADLILAMSQEHLDFINQMNKRAKDKATLLKLFGRQKSGSNEQRDEGVFNIKDPIGGGLEDFEHSFSEIQKEVERIFPELLRLAKSS